MFLDVKQCVRPKELGILDSHYWGQCTELDPEQYSQKSRKPTNLHQHVTVQGAIGIGRKQIFCKGDKPQSINSKFRPLGAATKNRAL